MKITEERINVNYLKYCKLLQKYGCYSEKLIDVYGEKIKLAPFSKSEDGGGCYDGGMIDVVIHRLCPLALSINSNVLGVIPGTNLFVDDDSLKKVLLLMHISKAEFFVPEKRSWMINNGNRYMFNDDLDVRNMKLGARSLYMCQSCGITFTETEFSAMMALDRSETETSSYDSPMASLVRFANVSVGIDMAISLSKRNVVVEEK